MIMLSLMLLSGIALTIFRLTDEFGKTQAKKLWISMLSMKLFFFIFLTPLTDLIVLSWVGTVGQSVLTEN